VYCENGKNAILIIILVYATGIYEYQIHLKVSKLCLKGWINACDSKTIDTGENDTWPLPIRVIVKSGV